MNLARRIINFPLNWMNFLFMDSIRKFFCYRRNFRMGYRVCKRGKDNVIECMGWNPELTVLMNGQHNRLHIGKDCTISRHCTMQIEGEGLEVWIGDGVYLAQCVNIVCQEKNCRIIIGNRCAIGHHTMIRSTDSHPITDCASGERINPQSDIVFGEHVWVAPRVTILKGVNIGSNAIIATGSVVTKDVPANSIAAGNPAKIVRENINWNIVPTFKQLDSRIPYLRLMDEER